MAATADARGMRPRRETRTVFLSAFFLLQLGIAPAGESADIDITPGDVFVADELVGLVHVDVETGKQTTIHPDEYGISENKGIVLDTDGRHLIYRWTDKLIRFDPISEASRVLSSGGYLNDFNGRVSLGPAGEVLFTSDRLVAPGDLDGTIVEVDRRSGRQTPLYTGGLLGGLGDVAFDSNSNLYVEAAGSVVRIDAASGAQVVFLFPDEYTHYGRIAMLPDDRLVVFRFHFVEGASVVTVDPSGTICSSFVVPYWATDVAGTAQGAVYYAGCTDTDEFCSEGVVQRLAPNPADFYWGVAPLAFDVVPLPEPAATLQLILGAAAMASVFARRHARRASE